MRASMNPPTTGIACRIIMPRAPTNKCHADAGAKEHFAHHAERGAANHGSPPLDEPQRSARLLRGARSCRRGRHSATESAGTAAPVVADGGPRQAPEVLPQVEACASAVRGALFPG